MRRALKSYIRAASSQQVFRPRGPPIPTVHALLKKRSSFAAAQKPKMATYRNGYTNGGNAPSKNIHHTVTALNRWSVANKQLPTYDKIKAIHVYDFDNTLFNSPLPNAKLWNGPTLGFLQTQDTFHTGGWWHDSRILAATGEGVEKEEPKAWEGWWNEQVAQLIQLSMEQKDALTVLLTGRSEGGFTDLIKKMVASKGLEFDMVVLKPTAGPNNQHFSSTMAFKQVFLESLVETYKSAEEIRVYEDRPKHTKGFRDFFMDYNRRQNGIGGVPTRGPITAEVIQVADGTKSLDPIVETAEVQRLINDHNLAVNDGRVKNPHRATRLMIKKTVFYTGYLITNDDTQKLLTLAQIPPNMPDTELKFLANNVLITPRPAPNSILDKVGGIGNKLLWEVTGTAVFENKIWAASVRPVPQSAKYYTENPSPIVVLALRKGAKPIDAGKIQNWQPVASDKAHIFETTVGEKVLLRVEDEDPRESSYERLFPGKAFKRKHAQDDDSQRNSSGQYGQQRDGHQPRGGGRGQGARGGNRGNGSGRGGRGSGGNRSGNYGGGAGRGKGRSGGGGHGYRSLDDVNPANGSAHGHNTPTISYEDFPPLGGQKGYPAQVQQQQQQQPPMGYQEQGYQQQGYQQPHAQIQQFQQYQPQFPQYQQYQQQPGQNQHGQQGQQDQYGQPNLGAFY